MERIEVRESENFPTGQPDTPGKGGKVNKALRAALYARYSTDKQSEASIPDQFRVCERIAAQHGFKVVERFSDRAISGGTAQRPDYQRMLEAARKREFDAIIAEDTSRLWRNQAEQAPRLAELSDLEIVVITHDLDTRQESAGLLGAVNGAMSEQYRREIGRRTRRGLEGLAREGKPTGGRAYGYFAAKDTSTGDIAVNSKEARWVVWIFERYAEGRSPRQIAAELNRKGVPSPGANWQRKKRRTDGRWLMTAVRAILRNERYIGRVVWGRMRWKRQAADSSRRVKLPATGALIKLRPDLRIIDDTLWKAAQTRIAAATAGRTTFHVPASNRRGAHTGHGGTAHRHALSGLLKCDCCNASYVIADSRSYACASHRDGGPSACNNALRARKDVIEGVVIGGLQEHLLRPEWLERVEAWVRSRVQAQQKAQAVAANAGADRLKALEVQIANVTDAIANKGLTGSRSMADKLLALETERDELKQRPATEAPVRLVPRLGDRVERFLRDLQRVIGQHPEQARMYLRRMLVEPVRLEPDGDQLWANFEVCGSRVALITGATTGPRGLGGSGGRI